MVSTSVANSLLAATLVEEYDILQTMFRKYSFIQYYGVLDDVADALDGNELYNTNRPDHVPAGQRFRDHKSTMKELGVGADRGDTLLKDQRQSVRNLSELDLHSTISYTKTIAIHKKDPSIMYTIGVPPKDNHQKNSRKGQSSLSVAIQLELNLPVVEDCSYEIRFRGLGSV